MPPSAETAPAANSSESPGRNGVTTSPVSQKMTSARTAYDQLPAASTSALRCASRWRMTSTASRRNSIRSGSRYDGARYCLSSRYPVAAGHRSVGLPVNATADGVAHPVEELVHHRDDQQRQEG